MCEMNGVGGVQSKFEPYFITSYPVGSGDEKEGEITISNNGLNRLLKGEPINIDDNKPIIAAGFLGGLWWSLRMAWLRTIEARNPEKGLEAYAKVAEKLERTLRPIKERDDYEKIETWHRGESAEMHRLRRVLYDTTLKLYLLYSKELELLTNKGNERTDAENLRYANLLVRRFDADGFLMRNLRAGGGRERDPADLRKASAIFEKSGDIASALDLSERYARGMRDVSEYARAVGLSRRIDSKIDGELGASERTKNLMRGFAGLSQEKGDYNTAAEVYLELGSYSQAAECFRSAGREEYAVRARFRAFVERNEGSNEFNYTSLLGMLGGSQSDMVRVAGMLESSAVTSKEYAIAGKAWERIGMPQNAVSLYEKGADKFDGDKEAVGEFVKRALWIRSHDIPIDNVDDRLNELQGLAEKAVRLGFGKEAAHGIEWFARRAYDEKGLYSQRAFLVAYEYSLALPESEREKFLNGWVDVARNVEGWRLAYILGERAKFFMEQAGKASSPEDKKYRDRSIKDSAEQAEVLLSLKRFEDAAYTLVSAETARRGGVDSFAPETLRVAAKMSPVQFERVALDGKEESAYFRGVAWEMAAKRCKQERLDSDDMQDLERAFAEYESAGALLNARGVLVEMINDGVGKGADVRGLLDREISLQEKIDAVNGEEMSPSMRQLLSQRQREAVKRGESSIVIEIAEKFITYHFPHTFSEGMITDFNRAASLTEQYKKIAEVHNKTDNLASAAPALLKSVALSMQLSGHAREEEGFEYWLSGRLEFNRGKKEAIIEKLAAIGDSETEPPFTRAMAYETAGRLSDNVETQVKFFRSAVQLYEKPIILFDPTTGIVRVNETLPVEKRIKVIGYMERVYEKAGRHADAKGVYDELTRKAIKDKTSAKFIDAPADNMDRLVTSAREGDMDRFYEEARLMGIDPERMAAEIREKEGPYYRMFEHAVEKRGVDIASLGRFYGRIRGESHLVERRTDPIKGK